MTAELARRELLTNLADKLRRLEHRRGSLADTQTPNPRTQLPSAPRVVSTGTPLDRFLPAGGWEPGLLVECLATGSGTGVETLALLLLRNWLGQGGAAGTAEPVAALEAGAKWGMLIDSRGDFYAPALAGWGLDPARWAVVQTREPGEVLWACEQALRCPGVAAVLCELPESVNDRALRRLQLAAEQGGGLGLLRRPARAARSPSWAAVRWQITPLPAPEGSVGRWLRVDQISGRRSVNESLVLEIDDETGDVCLAPAMAAAADRGHSASPRRRRERGVG